MLKGRSRFSLECLLGYASLPTYKTYWGKDMIEKKYKYDAAFSFLAHDESLALQLNDLLQDRCSTFLYSEQQKNIAGKDGEVSFRNVFKEESRIVAVLFRDGWGKTPWTRIEETAIRDRAYEHGYDFAIFIPLDEKPTVPEWLPKTKLWVGFDRWGINGAASVIEARVQECGGELHHETVSDRAARLQRAMEFKKKRDFIYSSAQGIEDTKKEYGFLISEVIRLIDDISKSAHLVKLDIMKAEKKIVVNSFDLGLSIEWIQKYINSLNESELNISLWENYAPFFGYTRLEQPRKLSTHSFQIDILPTEEYTWKMKAEQRSFLTNELAEFALKLFMDKMEAKIRK